ncbi:MAG: ThuA domain-containing protein [Gemmataceae bacterium]|nr:ThuA domain-containing protein [Gemmata sp.]MDW8196778.1 ThuA domain-containing protein [Gemmataceae bacterium]
MRYVLSWWAMLACASSAVVTANDALTPAEAVKRFKLPAGFQVRAVATEPMIRQPVSISFDARGRLWVLQYLQYPHYAGLKPVQQDQYLRTIYDKIPAPPPHGPVGADKITILYDPDENGVFRKSKDFVTGLNIASGFCLGRGGVYVAQPPYLLFYADHNEDDIPDGDPEVLLTGFGMDDTHSLANSLQWGPDGWLYGAAGSTSTSRIANPANPKEIIEFQQGIWRYHPPTRRFELFSEGGGNTYGLDFDRHGQAIAGTNWSGYVCLHPMQGAYYVKGFSKHGPLHNPYTYGYFEHVPYTGFKGGHVTCGGVVYDADVYPEQFRGRYIAGNLLANAIYWHTLEPVKASFTASFGGELMTTDDIWFRPVDLLLGPDGCIYVADWYDKRAAHLDPLDTWHKDSGRIYRIEYQGGPKYPTFDGRKQSTAALIEGLRNPNKWWRNEAQRLLRERGDKTGHATLRQWLVNEKGQLALEALWALYGSGGWTEDDFHRVGQHPNEHVRAWMVRLLGDDEKLTDKTLAVFTHWARTEKSPIVAAQLACSARRFTPVQAIAIVKALLENPLLSDDPHLPLLVWWAMEEANRRDTTDTVQFPYPGEPNRKLASFFNERVARRLLSGQISRGTERIGLLLARTQQAGDDLTPVLRGIATALQAHPGKDVIPALREPLADLLKQRPDDLLVLEVLARMGDADACSRLRRIVADPSARDNDRLRAVALLRDVRDPRAQELFLQQLTTAPSDKFRIELLSGLEAFEHDAVGAAILAGYAGFSRPVKNRALQTLLTRPNWALQLLQQFDSGKFPRADFTLDHARAAVKLDHKDLTAIVEKHFGKLAPATPGEKQARIGGLSIALKKERGDPVRGKVLFTKLCAACHQLHGEGGAVGPDLTTSDRKNTLYLLTHIVDPSSAIRPEYLVYSVLTHDDRKFSGIATDSGETIILTNVVNDQVVKTTLAKADIAAMKPSPVSLMPEKLLDSLTEAQVADLFAYLASDAPKKAFSAPPDPKNSASRKWRVVMVSGSFEYKSDASLAEYKKYLEAHFPVECRLITAKAEKDTALPGLEALDDCDVAIFFTRRLRLEGESLEAVKKYVRSGKPIVGIRTASHGFQNWLEMDQEVFGGNYQGHFGAGTTTVQPVEKAKDHPILRGVKPFQTVGTLYKNPNVAPDVTILLQGTMGQESQPVAWIREKDNRRVFYTSLGHPDDFKDENFLRLLTNGLAWVIQSDWKK